MNDSGQNETGEAVTTALWVPSWFELDQSLQTDVVDQFYFCKQVPIEWLGRPALQEFLAPNRQPSIDLIFFNQMPTDDAEIESRFCTIRSISHQTLGPLTSVCTKGLDYQFVLENGQAIEVNAEESPGSASGAFADVQDWTLTVSLVDCSEPAAPS